MKLVFSQYGATATSSGWFAPAISTREVRKGHAGVAATEFAFVCPLLLLFALACCDFGRIAHFHEVVANAARAGAETGATRKFTDFTRPFWETEIRDAVVREMQNLHSFEESKMSYRLATTMDADGLARIVVDVSYPFRTTVSWPGLPAETRLHQRIEFRQFR
jgi:Flp pilus assembly protein TadG